MAAKHRASDRDREKRRAPVAPAAGGRPAPGHAARAAHGARGRDPLAIDRLYHRCPVEDVPFTTTASSPDISAIIGQERAVEAIELAITSSGVGFNVFALGPSGIGKATALRQFLAGRAAEAPTPDDWCYVHDFGDPQRPRALRLPAGTGVALREEMTHLCLELRGAIPAAFESDEYRRRKEAIEAEFEAHREAGLAEVERHGKDAGIALVRTPVGIGLAPTHDGEVLAPDEFRRLPETDQARVRADVAKLESELGDVLRQVPHWQRETRSRLRDLVGEVVAAAVGHLIEELRHRFGALPAVVTYLDDVERDVVGRAPEFLALASQTEGVADLATSPVPDGGPFRRYGINVIVGHDTDGGAPIVNEDHPTYANLVGRIEYVAQLGTLVTDFMLIRAGALHRANGGYLVLEADKVLMEPYAWEELKRALRTREVRVEPLGQSLGLLTTATLEPEPIPLDVKVALLGDRRLYYLLCAYDREFLDLFKVAADFADDVDWTPGNTALYARLIATLARREALRPFSAAATARTIEHLARLAEDAGKLSTNMGRLVDLMHEADHWAARHVRATVAPTDVDHAIDARIRRSSRLQERLQEEIARDTIRIDTEGAVVGQINALSVVQLGDQRFGHPSRVTAAVRVGRGEVVDIEREVELGGPIHSKGVLILEGFLAGRFGRSPLALHASLVFEQSYGAVEGDSASLAETCALLSAIGGVPIRQDFAVTGSIDQHGSVQAIGGVNEKIEGFFDACTSRGRTAEHAVLIPAANVRHLMLAARVRRAARAGRFRVFAVATVDDALELLTGMPAGVPDADGTYPHDTVFGRVQAALVGLADIAERFGGGVAREVTTVPSPKTDR